jgi:hypothetical protein
VDYDLKFCLSDVEDENTDDQKGADQVTSSQGRASGKKYDIPDYVKNIGTRKSEQERERDHGSGSRYLDEDELLVAG